MGHRLLGRPRSCDRMRSTFRPVMARGDRYKGRAYFSETFLIRTTNRTTTRTAITVQIHIPPFAPKPIHPPLFIIESLVPHRGVNRTDQLQQPQLLLGFAADWFKYCSGLASNLSLHFIPQK